MWHDITEKDKKAFNELATHPLQSYEWGEFRKKNGIVVIREGFFRSSKLVEAFQLTLHSVPHTPWTIGYLPKGTLPTKELLEELQRIGKENNCIFIQLEPNIQISNFKFQISNFKLVPSVHPLFTKYTLQIDLTKSEEELLKAMHPKARYNIKVAQKHGVVVKEQNTQNAFDTFWQLTRETTSRQQFFAHTKKYHQEQWDTLPHTPAQHTLSSHLFIARFHGKPLTAWILFLFKDVLYYPYGASSNEHREMMHSTLMMWEAIRFGKKIGANIFDLWGAAAPQTPESDPWFGFTQFKERFGPTRVEFIGSFDFVINPFVYRLYTLVDKIRHLLLRVM